MATRKSGEKARLDAGAWTRAGLEVLAEGGIDGVKVEALARRLNVTKGSFYWHFADRDALLNAMLEDWRRRATIALIDRLEASRDTPQEKFRALLALPTAGNSMLNSDIELAVRLWGRRDPRAQTALTEVDELRLRYLTQLLVLAGVPDLNARARALVAYCYIRVARSLIPMNAKDLIGECEALLLGDVQSGLSQ